MLAIALAGGTSAGSEAAKQHEAAALPAAALKDAASLYLREAVSDPVRWQPWGESAFKLAQSLKRPVLVDIGAVWCHWCHVMDQGTYSDAKVAELINSRFVPIKVDADERPDVDSYYQNAAEAFGAGGWPLTCFTTADGAPLFIAGYMPPRAPRKDPSAPGMTYLLQRVADEYATDPDFAKAATGRISAGGSSHKPGGAPTLRTDLLLSLGAAYDRQNGGFSFGSGARFYDFGAVQLALAHGFFGHPKFTDMALGTLRKIAAGGVYDQLGGGFHRYSTDAQWRVPHFEKMAYDQAMAITTYAQAYEQSGDPEFKRVAMETIRYVNHTLLDPKTHTFYSHQDADAFRGDDGSYYTWTRDEVRRALDPEQARAALLYFGFEQRPARAPDGRIVLYRALGTDQIASRLGVTRARAETLLSRALAAMEKVRERRRPPAVDRALLVDSNALMATAYLTAAEAFGDPGLKDIALEDLDYIRSHLRSPEGSFYHVLANSKVEVPGLVADQVYMLSAMVAAYQASGAGRYLDDARGLADRLIKDFREPESGLLNNRVVGDKGTVLAAAKGSTDVLFDRPMPSPQASAAIALEALAVLTADKHYGDEASELLSRASADAPSGAGVMLGTLGLALEERNDGESLVAAVDGPKDVAGRRALIDAALATYRPGKVVLALGPDTATTRLPETARAKYRAVASHGMASAFLCEGADCAGPVSKPADLAGVIREFGVTAPRAVAGHSGASTRDAE